MKLCGRCGYPTKQGERIHSRHTGKTYCIDDVACDRRRANQLTHEEIIVLSNVALKQINKVTA